MKSAEEFEGEYHIHRMEADEIVESFDCGDRDLNDFILNASPLYRSNLLAVTYVIAPVEDPDNIIGYCALANDIVSLNDFESHTAVNRFRRKHRIHYSKRLTSFPAIKVCRLGVDQSMKYHGIGTLLLDYVKSSFSVDPKAGCRFVTVDAYSDAIPFYEKNGFSMLKSSDEKLRLTKPVYFDLDDIVHSRGK